MTLLNWIYQFLNTPSDVPQSYGTYHLTCVALTIVASILLVALFKNANEKTVRALAAIAWIVMVVFEIGKQILFCLHMSEAGEFSWSYYWYFLPFQFCSSPLYILPIVAFAKDSKFRDAAIIFLGTFGFFAGACVYAFPGDVFLWFRFINIQTMVHHGIQVFFGAYLAMRYREKLSFKNLVRATGVFVGLCAIAMAINLLTYHTDITGAYGGLNMFFISPYYPCTLPVLSMIYPLVPYPAFLCIYVFGFMLCAGLVMLLMKGLAAIFCRKTVESK